MLCHKAPTSDAPIASHFGLQQNLPLVSIALDPEHKPESARPLRALLLHNERGAASAVRDTAHNLGLYEPSGTGAAAWAELCYAQLPPSRIIHQDAGPFGSSFLLCLSLFPNPHDWEHRRTGAASSAA